VNTQKKKNKNLCMIHWYLSFFRCNSKCFVTIYTYLYIWVRCEKVEGTGWGSGSNVVLRMREELVVQEGYVTNEERHLTVLKTSLFFNGDGFAVYDSKGQLVFRFDSYGPRARDKDELVLMDPNGRSLLTLRRKVQYNTTFFFFLFLRGRMFLFRKRV